MTTCAHCGAEVGDASSCPRCGRLVTAPLSAPWRTDTAERPAVRDAVEPAPAASMPGPARYPLYADEDAQTYAETAVHHPVSAPPAYLPPEGPSYDEPAERGSPGWLPWAVVAAAMVLMAVSGIWLVVSPGGDGATGTPTPQPSVSKIGANQSPTPRSPAPTTAATDVSPSSSTPAGGEADVAGQATATAPRSAPPNEDVFGNRTTYVAANMLDGRPDTCWRMAGDGTGAVLSFQLAAPTTLTRVGMVNGYAKKALEGGHELDWYAGNRRVLAAQWVFDDGSTLDQPLSGSTKSLQTIDLPAPVTTSTVQLRLVTVSAPGTGRSARNYTAISEVSLVGTPAS